MLTSESVNVGTLIMDIEIIFYQSSEFMKTNVDGTIFNNEQYEMIYS